MKFSNLRFLALLGALGLGGCFTGPYVPPPSAIEASDDGVFQPVGRLSKSLSRLQGPPSDPQSGHAIELGFTKGSGSGSQNLSSNRIVFGNQTFTAPQQMRYEFDLTYFDVAYRWRKFFGQARAFGIEALGGLGFANLDFSAMSATQRASEEMSSGGVAAGLGALWRLRPGTSVQFRGSSFFSGEDNGVTEARRLDLYLVQALGRHMALRAGYTSWDIKSKRNDSLSPVKVQFSGPSLGLDVMF